MDHLSEANESATAVILGGNRFVDREGAPDPVGTEASSTLPDAIPEPESLDRRAAVRFPIEQDVRYKVFKGRTIEVGSGKTINMSSHGILFTTHRLLAIGERLEVAVNWPARLDSRIRLKLVIVGRVVRSEGGQAAILIERHEFRTRGGDID